MQLFEHVRVREVLLVVLHDQRDLLERAPVGGERAPQLLEGGDVLVDALAARVDHEDHAVDAVEKLLAGRRVLARARHRDDLDPRAHPRDLAELDREPVVAHGGIEAGRHLLEAPAVIRSQLGVDRAQVRRLARALDAPVDDPRVDLPALRVRLGHHFPFLCSSRRACVATADETSLLFMSERRSRSWR